MSDLITISNETLSVSISSFGAELSSVKKNGKELLWQADPNIWDGRCPILFPICGGLKEGKYIFNEKEYSLPKHGFARISEFDVESVTDTTAVFLLKSNEETKEMYPFDFEFRAVFRLSGSALTTTYETKNISNENLFFSVGAHEAYSCPNGIEEYSIIFEKPEKLAKNLLSGNLLEDKTVDLGLGDSVCELPLKYDYFTSNALVFTNLKSRKAVLINKNTRASVSVDFSDFDYFLVWTKPNAPYVCLEPWCGLPDFVGSSFDFTEKRGIIKLAPLKKDSKNHTIVF